jgi:murein DD-endopeptidase MepM/ murein hydrolase activator NlpD
MGTVRLSLTLLACSVLLAAALGDSAAAAGNGGAVAPKARSVASPSGGAKVGQRPATPRRKATSREERGHHFPVAGVYDLGGEAARFGAPRRGHRHQGHDVAAAEGTPVVAPWAGTVEFVRFQRRAAGWYVVLDGDGEDRDYVFMHLRRGSIVVAAGEHVAAGQSIAEVGRTGRASGPHLHFEIWVGGWYAGGEPIDPLPLLSEWAG